MRQAPQLLHPGSAESTLGSREKKAIAMKHTPSLWKSALALVALATEAASAILTPTAFGASSITFDFDSGSPVPSLGSPTPFSYSSGGITASFSSPSPLGSFSVQDGSTLPVVAQLSLFSGQFLSPDSTSRATLDIHFDQQLTSVSLTFSTAQSTAVETPNPLTATAYLGSTAGPIVGSPVTRSGSFLFGSEPMPTGSLSVTSDAAHPFDTLRISLGAGGASGILLDNLVVTPVPEPAQSAAVTLGVVGLGALVLRRRATRRGNVP